MKPLNSNVIKEYNRILDKNRLIFSNKPENSFFKKPFDSMGYPSNTKHFFGNQRGYFNEFGGPCTTNVYDKVAVTGTEWALNSSGNYIRLGTKIIAGSSAIDKYIEKVKFSLRKFNSPTGNAVVRVRDSGDTIKAFSGNLDVSTLTTSFADIEFTLDQRIKLASGDRVLIEYNTSADPNSLRVEAKTETTLTGFNWTGYVASYSDTTTTNNSMTFDSDPTCP